MTFLEICQMTAQQTGTIEGTLPTTVVGQTRRLKQIVDFVREAYIDIQNAHRMWRWLQSSFFGPTDLGVSNYAGTDFSDEYTWVPVTRFSQWGFKGDMSDISLSMYPYPPNGTNELQEGPLRWLSYDRFFETQMRGVMLDAKPQFYTVLPNNSLSLAPYPGVVAGRFMLRGKYRKSAQILAADADVPEMPAEYHTIIKDAALQYIEGFDEGPRIPIVRLRLLPNFSMLEAHQLPKVTWGEPLA